MPTPPPGPMRAISSRQLHMVARAELVADPTITMGEWKDRIYDRLLAYGFGYPQHDALATAMRSVERHLERRTR